MKVMRKILPVVLVGMAIGVILYMVYTKNSRELIKTGTHTKESSELIKIGQAVTSGMTASVSEPRIPAEERDELYYKLQRFYLFGAIEGQKVEEMLEQFLTLYEKDRDLYQLLYCVYMDRGEKKKAESIMALAKDKTKLDLYKNGESDFRQFQLRKQIYMDMEAENYPAVADALRELEMLVPKSVSYYPFILPEEDRIYIFSHPRGIYLGGYDMGTGLNGDAAYVYYDRDEDWYMVLRGTWKDGKADGSFQVSYTGYTDGLTGSFACDMAAGSLVGDIRDIHALFGEEAELTTQVVHAIEKNKGLPSIPNTDFFDDYQILNISDYEQKENIELSGPKAGSELPTEVTILFEGAIIKDSPDIRYYQVVKNTGTRDIKLSGKAYFYGDQGNAALEVYESFARYYYSLQPDGIAILEYNSNPGWMFQKGISVSRIEYELTVDEQDPYMRSEGLLSDIVGVCETDGQSAYYSLINTGHTKFERLNVHAFFYMDGKLVDHGVNYYNNDECPLSGQILDGSIDFKRRDVSFDTVVIYVEG